MSDAQFLALAAFDNIDAKRYLTFERASFLGEAHFMRDVASADRRIANVTFSRARFSERPTLFNGARFTGLTRFTETRFAGEVMFERARFLDEARFDLTEFARRTSFVDGGFDGRVEFNKTRFDGPADFTSAEFKEIRVADVTFAADVDFRDAKVRERG